MGGLISLVFIFYPLYQYIDKFKPNGISDNPAEWAQFGDYIGGTTNVIIGILNIVATIILALVIKNLDDSRSKIKDKEDEKRHLELIEIENLRHRQNLNLQNTLFTKQLKHSIYLEFNEHMRQNYNCIVLGKADSEHIKEFSTKLNSFSIFLNCNKYYFKDLQDSVEITSIHDSFHLILNCYKIWDHNSTDEIKNTSDKIAKLIQDLNIKLLTEIHNKKSEI